MRYFFLPAIGLAGPLRVRALVWVRCPRTGKPAAMTQPAVAAEIHQSLDVHGDFAPQIALDHIVAVDHFAQLKHFLIGQLGYPARIGYRTFCTISLALQARCREYIAARPRRAYWSEY